MTTPLPLIPWSKTSILTSRMHLDASRIAQQAALDLFVLGSAEQVYILLETIHEYGRDMTTKDHYSRTTSKQIQGAWGGSDSWPSWAHEASDGDADADADADVGTISTTGLPKDIARKAQG